MSRETTSGQGVAHGPESDWQKKADTSQNLTDALRNSVNDNLKDYKERGKEKIGGLIEHLYYSRNEQKEIGGMGKTISH